MSERICLNCEFWGYYPSPPHVPDTLRSNPDRRHECGHEKLSGQDDHSPDGVDGYQDKWGWDPVRTGPRFGCIHFKEKD